MDAKSARAKFTTIVVTCFAVCITWQLWGQMTPEESQVWKRYRTPGCSSSQLVKPNVVFFNTHNTTKHEMAKAEMAWKLRQMGHSILTEAESGDRRVDLVDLTEDQEYEFETDEKRAERFKGMKNVFVVKLWLQK